MLQQSGNIAQTAAFHSLDHLAEHPTQHMLFAAALEQLKAPSDRIVADGSTPWRIGLSSGGATGWPAPDRMANLLLRTQPPV